MRNVLTLAILLTLATCARAELSLVINGPTEATTGNLVVLNSVGSVAHATEWIPPKALKDKTAQCGEQIFFATSEPGEYLFTLTGTDGQHLSHVQHTVVIPSPLPIPIPDEPPPTEPPPPSDPSLTDLQELSRSLSTGLNDQETRARLGLEVMSADFSGTLEEAFESVEKTIFLSLNRRNRENETDWQAGWYIPVLKALNDRIQNGTITDTASYKTAMEYVSRGLR